MAWERGTYEYTCPKCGIKYEVEYQNVPARDRDDFTCECGEKIIINSTRAYLSHKKIP